MVEPRVIGPEYETGYNGTGSAIAAGIIVIGAATPDPPDEIAKASAKNEAYMGVTAHAIANAERGDVQISGVTKVTSGAAIAAGNRVTSDANGKGTPAAATESFIGYAKTAATGADQTVEVELVQGGGGPAMGT